MPPGSGDRRSPRQGSGGKGKPQRRTESTPPRASGSGRPGAGGKKSAAKGRPGAPRSGERRTTAGGSARAAGGRGRSEERPVRKAAPVRKGWGSLTRRGAGVVRGDDTRGGTRAGGTPGRRADDRDDQAPPAVRGRLSDRSPTAASDVWREATEREPEPPWEPEQWIEEPDEDDGLRREAKGAVRRAETGTRAGEGRARPRSARRADTTSAVPAPKRRRGPAPSREVADELAREAGATQAPKLGQRLAEATRAFERERYPEAKKLLRPLAERAPGSAVVRELHGLTLYRLGLWRAAAKELEAFRTLTGSTEQHPVLADIYRALHQYDQVEELWAELRASSPTPELVAEGRIVMAGALADRGDLSGAIHTIEQGLRTPKRLRDHHLRLLYALADLRERAGDIPEARTAFRRIAAAEPDFADVGTRLRALG